MQKNKWCCIITAFENEIQFVEYGFIVVVTVDEIGVSSWCCCQCFTRGFFDQSMEACTILSTAMTETPFISFLWALSKSLSRTKEECRHRQQISCGQARQRVPLSACWNHHLAQSLRTQLIARHQISKPELLVPMSY